MSPAQSLREIMLVLSRDREIILTAEEAHQLGLGARPVRLVAEFLKTTVVPL